MKVLIIDRQQANLLFAVCSLILIDREGFTHLIYGDRHFEQFKSSH